MVYATWSEGYVADAEYSRHCYTSLAPSLLSFVSLMGGVQPSSLTPEFQYCELGCGYGMSTIVMAAATPSSNFWGIDFNPEFSSSANYIKADAALENVAFLEHSFEHLSCEAHKDLPDFDFVTLHGVWSWISEKNRHHILDFIGKKLKPGGIVYISYNALPGTNLLMPMQKLFYEIFRMNGNGSARSIDESVRFLESAEQAGTCQLTGNPGYKAFMDRLRSRDLGYIYHEFLNSDWESFYHIDVARHMTAAKLNFVGTTDLIDLYPAQFLQPEQRKLLDRITDSSLANTFLDYCRQNSFRRDVFVKGGRKLSQGEKQRLIDETVFVSLIPDTVKPDGRASTGTNSERSTRLYTIILEILADSPKSLRQICDVPALRKCPGPTLLEACAAMIASGKLAPIPPGFGSVASEPAQRLNAVIADRAFSGSSPNHFAAPAARTGARASGFDQMVFSAINQAHDGRPEAIKDALLKQMKKHGGNDLQDFTDVDFSSKNEAALTKAISTILSEKLPLWKRLGVVAQTFGELPARHSEK